MSNQLSQRGDNETCERTDTGGRRSFLKACAAGVVGALSLGTLGTDVASADHFPVYNHGEDITIPAENLSAVSPEVNESGTNWRRRVFSTPSPTGVGLGTTAYSGGAGFIQAKGWIGLLFTAAGQSDFETGFGGNGYVPAGYSTITGIGTGTAYNIVDFVLYDWTTNRELVRQRVYNYPNATVFNFSPIVTAVLRPGHHYGIFFETFSAVNAPNVDTKIAFLLATIEQINVLSL